MFFSNNRRLWSISIATLAFAVAFFIIGGIAKADDNPYVTMTTTVSPSYIDQPFSITSELHNNTNNYEHVAWQIYVDPSEISWTWPFSFTKDQTLCQINNAALTSIEPYMYFESVIAGIVITPGETASISCGLTSASPINTQIRTWATWDQPAVYATNIVSVSVASPVDFSLNVFQLPYPTPGYSFGIGMAITSVFSYTGQIALSIPGGINIPYFCNGPSTCFLNFGSSDKSGSSTYYLYGHVTVTDSYTFTATFTEINTGITKTITTEVYLAATPTPPPQIIYIIPSPITPGKTITIQGSFLSLPGNQNGLSVWFTDPATGGTNWLSYNDVIAAGGFWNSNTIILNVPENLWPCRNIVVTVVRENSYSTPYPTRTKCFNYFPIVMH